MIFSNAFLWRDPGGGDSLLNRLPPVVAKYFWYLVLLWIIINALAMLIIFSIAVAALRQNNDLEDEGKRRERFYGGCFVYLWFSGRHFLVTNDIVFKRGKIPLIDNFFVCNPSNGYMGYMAQNICYMHTMVLMRWQMNRAAFCINRKKSWACAAWSTSAPHFIEEIVT